MQYIVIPVFLKVLKILTTYSFSVTTFSTLASHSLRLTSPLTLCQFVPRLGVLRRSLSPCRPCRAFSRWSQPISVTPQFNGWFFGLLHRMQAWIGRWQLLRLFHCSAFCPDNRLEDLASFLIDLLLSAQRSALIFVKWILSLAGCIHVLGTIAPKSGNIWFARWYFRHSSDTQGPYLHIPLIMVDYAE